MAVAPSVVKLRAPLLLVAFAVSAAFVACAALTGLAGCTASKHAAAAPAPAPRGPVLDASYDWRGQVTVPFGVLFKSSPVPLHEVLLFHDEGAADAENKDCYAIDGTPPRLVGQTPDTYLLCFDNDRLNRIESSVHLATEIAPQVFAQACAAWQAAVSPAETCEGRSGTIRIAAHLLSAPGEPSTLSLVLSNANPVP